jgi:hypothetical protein
MPMITITDGDINRGKIVTPAWYLMRIDSVGEKPSKDGGSTNYPVEGTILADAESGSEEFKDVSIEWNFNSKAIGFTVGFLKSLGVEVVPGRYRLEDGVGKVLKVYVENDTYQGRLVNRVNHKYQPLN